MKRVISVLLLLVACSKPAHVDTPAPAAAIAPESICALIEGHVADWRGMPELALDAGPACLGVPVGHGVDEHFGFRHFVAYKLAHADVRVLGTPSEATVVEIVPSTPLDAAPVLAALPDADARVARGDGIVELVYGGRGLALLVATSSAGEHVTRVRGFKPMPAAVYEQKLGPHQRLGFP